MTREEAIAYFKDMNECTYGDVKPIQMAIKALEKESKTGRWIKSNIPNEEYVCSECGGACWYYDYQASVAKSRYCPNCGLKMESEG